MRRILLMTTFALVAVGAAFAQGVTTASISGKVTDQKGEVLPGATVVALHSSSGTQYGITTDASGFYRIPNMRVGGPYTITVTFVGYNNFVQNEVFLTLGQNYKLDATMAETSTELAEVTVRSTSDVDKTGQKTVIDQRTINSAPTIARAIADFARFNPLANIQQNTDGFSISLAGQNNRYNTVYVDGTVNNDVFGLAGSGTNGGQTGVQPISLDAIEQFQVSVSPFDVRQSGFSGGAINAVTRSGTNDIEGSVYYLFRNEGMAGKTPIDDSSLKREKLSDFSAKTYGVRLGGPIIKDKLFFFVNAELQREETPQPFDFATYTGKATRDTLNALVEKLGEYGYNPGGFENNVRYLDSDKFLIKFDWNINANHKLTLRHSFVNAKNLEARRSTTNSIGYINGSEYFVSKVHTSALELKSSFGNRFANKFVLGATIADDDRDPSGDPFPSITITDGPGASITIGSEAFSTANLLEQKVFTITNDFEIYKGKHIITIGTHNEFYDMGNLFIRQNYGAYSYDSVAQFLYDINVDRYDRSFSQIDNVTGDGSKAIAAFKAFQVGLYVQDEFQATDRLKLTLGLRLDMPVFPDAPLKNEDFDENSVPAIEAEGYDLKGSRPGQFIDKQLLFSPRFGFNWDINGDQSLSLRGGLGIFTSRVPLVWPGGAFNNFGFNIGGVTVTDGSIPFNPDVDDQYPVVDLDNPVPSGQIDLFSSDFKLPQVFKASVGVDKALPWGLVATFEALYTKTLNNIRYENLNLKQSTQELTGTPDDRPVFNQNDRVDATYTGIYLASNTSKGYSYNLVAQLTKQFDNGFSGSFAYTYGDAFSTNDGLSSQNNSQWRGYQNIDGINIEGDAQRSVYSMGHRVILQASYRKEYLKFAATQVSFFYNGQSGQPFSYVVGNEANNRRLVNDGAFDNANLIYVPEVETDIILLDKTVGSETYTAAEQWEILDQYIKDDKYLSGRRGDYAERNMSRTPFEGILDFRLVQEFYLKMANGKRNTLQLTWDIFNFSNFLNKDWGRRYFITNNNFAILEFAGYIPTTTTPQYRVNTNILEGEDPWKNNITDSGFRSSRWQMQIGLRYTFGN